MYLTPIDDDNLSFSSYLLLSSQACVAGTTFSASGSGSTPCNACTAGATCLFGVKTACTKTTDTVCQVYDKVCFK